MNTGQAEPFAGAVDRGRNDPAADPQVERVARILAGGPDNALDPDEIMEYGEPLWRAWVERAVGAIAAHRMLTIR